jgi:hypothetical protein
MADIEKAVLEILYPLIKRYNFISWSSQNYKLNLTNIGYTREGLIPRGKRPFIIKSSLIMGIEITINYFAEKFRQHFCCW